MNPLLEVREVNKSFKKQPALTNINFVIEPGFTYGLIGRNGAGKTTLINLILGILQPDSGEILNNGLPIQQRKDQNIGFALGQGLYPSLTAREHLELLSLLKSNPISHSELLQKLELDPHSRKRVKNFSMGMKQRLRLALALNSNYPLILLDEPLNGLDPEGIKWFRGYIKEIQSQGTTFLLSSHILSETEKVIDKAIFLDKEIEWQGDLEEAIRLSPGGTLESFYYNLKAGKKNG